MVFVDVLLETPGVDLRDCRKEWPLLRDELLALSLRGNLVTGAWSASAVETLGEHLVTFDKDFKRRLPAQDFTLLRATN